MELSKIFEDLIKILTSNKKIKGKNIDYKKPLLFKRKDFNEIVLKKAEQNLRLGIVRKYLKKKKYLKIIKFV